MKITRMTREEMQKATSLSDWDRAMAIPDEDLDTSDFDIDQAVLVSPTPTPKARQKASHPTADVHP